MGCCFYDAGLPGATVEAIAEALRLAMEVKPGKLLLRYARQMQAMRADIAREMGATLGDDERLPIAVNADSLATWFAPAVAAFAAA